MIKKIFLCLMILCSSVLLVGCGEEMTPTEAVRDYLEGYVTLDSSVTNQLDDYIFYPQEAAAYNHHTIQLKSYHNF